MRVVVIIEGEDSEQNQLSKVIRFMNEQEIPIVGMLENIPSKSIESFSEIGDLVVGSSFSLPEQREIPIINPKRDLDVYEKSKSIYHK